MCVMCVTHSISHAILRIEIFYFLFCLFVKSICFEVLTDTQSDECVCVFALSGWFGWRYLFWFSCFNANRQTLCRPCFRSSFLLFILVHIISCIQITFAKTGKIKMHSYQISSNSIAFAYWNFVQRFRKVSSCSFADFWFPTPDNVIYCLFWIWNFTSQC